MQDALTQTLLDRETAPQNSAKSVVQPEGGLPKQ